MKRQLVIALVGSAALMAGVANAVDMYIGGVGGIAGSAAFNIGPGGGVTEATVAAAIGKDSAYAGSNAAGVGGTLDSFALGTGGSIAFHNDRVYLDAVTQDANRGVAQVNEIDFGLNFLDIVLGGMGPEE